MTSLPTVVVSSVVRSSHKGESHGGVYLVDLERCEVLQVIDWDDEDISWEGRGADRGLRGIALQDGRVYLAASDEIFVYDRDFTRLGSFTNPYLRHVHEIALDGDVLWATSTGFDSLLGYDLTREEWTVGYYARWALGDRLVRRAARGRARPRPVLRPFDPTSASGPPAGDTCHLNSVAVTARGGVTLSGTQVGHLLQVGDGGGSFARIPLGTHNAQPFRDGVVINHTARDRVAWLDRRGRTRREYAIPRYEPQRLEYARLPNDMARQAFGRGLVVYEDRYLIAGSSPATVTVHDVASGERVRSVNLTMDVRNAVHGLHVWPSS